MIAGIDVSDPVRVLVRDAATGRWLQFSHPREIVTALTLADVPPALERVEQAVTGSGLYAAGFVSYEAAPAFDPALTVRGGGGFPLLWFGLYDGVEQWTCRGSFPHHWSAPVPGRSDTRTQWGLGTFQGARRGGACCARGRAHSSPCRRPRSRKDRLAAIRRVRGVRGQSEAHQGFDPQRRHLPGQLYPSAERHVGRRALGLFSSARRRRRRRPMALSWTPASGSSAAPRRSCSSGWTATASPADR